MISSPQAWVLIYLLLLLLPSLALGVMAARRPRLLIVPQASRFLIGFSVTPFVLAVWMLLLAGILPGSPRWMFLLPPSAVAVVPLYLYGPNFLGRVIRKRQLIRISSRNYWPVYLTYVCATLLVTLVTSKLIINAQAPIAGHDALVYANEALEFARSRSIFEIPDFRGTADDVIPGHPHSFIYQAFLSHSLLTTESNKLGFPHDHACRVAVQALFLYMLCGVLALAKTSRYLGVGALTLVLLLQVPKFEYISYFGSRDAFRLIPILLLAATLTGLSPRRLRHKLHTFSLLPCLLFVTFSLAAHTMNAVMVGSITLAWLIWVLIENTPRRNILLVLGAICTGLLIASVHYVKSFIDTGNPIGYGFSYYAYFGTPLWEALLRENNRFSQAINASTAQRLTMFFELDYYRLSVEGLIGAVLSVVYWTAFKREEMAKSTLFIALVVFTSLLPLSGLFDFTTLKLSDIFLINHRYILHWYPFASICVAMLVLHLYYKYILFDNRKIKTLAAAGFVLFVLAITALSYTTVLSSWRVRNVNASKNWMGWKIKSALDKLPVEARILVDDDRWSYYLCNRTVYIYSHPAWKTIRAKNETELHSALKDLDIRYVLLKEKRIHNWWDQITLFSYLNDPEKASLIIHNKHFRIYKLNTTVK